MSKTRIYCFTTPTVLCKFHFDITINSTSLSSLCSCRGWLERRLLKAIKVKEKWNKTKLCTFLKLDRKDHRIVQVFFKHQLTCNRLGKNRFWLSVYFLLELFSLFRNENPSEFIIHRHERLTNDAIENNLLLNYFRIFWRRYFVVLLFLSKNVVRISVRMKRNGFYVRPIFIAAGAAAEWMKNCLRNLTCSDQQSWFRSNYLISHCRVSRLLMTNHSAVWFKIFERHKAASIRIDIAIAIIRDHTINQIHSEVCCVCTIFILCT